MILSADDIRTALTVVGGTTLGYVARLFTSEAKTVREMHFIKGKLEQLVGLLQTSEEVRVKQAVMEESFKTIRKDLDAAHRMIRATLATLPPLPKEVT